MKKRIIFVDIRNKLINESTLFECFVESDTIVALTPYSNYLLDKHNVDYVLFSDLKSNEEFISDVISDYHYVAGNFLKLGLNQYQFIFRDIGKYITFEHYVRAVNSKIKQYKSSVYISNVDDKKGFGKDAPLSRFLEFSSEVTLDSDEKFYKKNRLKAFISKIKATNVFKHCTKKIMEEDFYLYDNKINAKDYKKTITKIKYSSEELVSHRELLKLTEGISFNLHIGEMLIDEISTLLIQEKTGSAYIPFVFLNGASMYSRFLNYKSNNIPAVFVQHGSYINVDFFLKYNEVLPADISLVFNEYTKELFESMGANDVHCIGTRLYNKNVNEKNKEFDFVYITYCTKYSYPGFFVASEVDVLSPVAENIFNRHKEIIDLFGKHFPEKKICIKVQPGIFTGQQLYIPLNEYSEKYPNVTIVFNEPLHTLIEKSKHIISDYFSSEFSNRNILGNKDIIMFTDIIKLPNVRVKEELDNIIFLVDDFTEMYSLIANFDSESRNKNSAKSQKIIDRYSSDNLDTKSIVCKIINEKLEKEYHC